jgi:riboflavin kinase/FMN adenylyltransferase
MFEQQIRNGVFALGNFDGAHRGHRVVVDAAIAVARARNLPARVLTFEPHPRAVFVPENPPFRLTPFAVKESLLKAWGVDDVIALPFTLDFAQIEPQAFVENILCKQFGAQHIVAGYDFTFGYKRGGDMAKLAAWLNPHDVSVTEIAPFADAGGTVISSTRIRDFLRMGDVAAAIGMLGHEWSLAGVVMQGAQRGRTIGVPTANIALGEYLRPKFGVYAITANRVGDTQSYRGVANIGVRPTLDGQSENLEAYLFDFDRDIYGQEWEFALQRFIRPEQKFGSLSELKVQITQDIGAAQA